jgi:hypothetical protein
MKLREILAINGGELPRLAGGMPRVGTIELAYVPLAAEATIEAKKAIKGWEGLEVEIEQPLEPILFDIYIPQMSIKKLNATVKFFIEDVTGAAQIIQETVIEGVTAVGKASPVEVQRRYVPEKDATINPTLEGIRKFTISAEASAESATIPANTAKLIAYLHILGLARQ